MDYRRFLPRERQASVAPSTSVFWPWRDGELHALVAARPEAPVRVLVVHGAGGHAGALWPIASAVAGDHVDLTAIDLPLFGRTRVPGDVTYQAWVDALVDYIAAHDDGRPLVLFGASMGGLLAVDAASRSGRVAHVVATCLLDPHDPEARAAMMRVGWLGRHAPRLVRLIAGPLRRLRVPIAALAPLRKMSKDPGLSRACAQDPRGGGGWVPLGFLRGFIEHPRVQSTVPVTLAHPADDSWTPPHLSDRVLARFTGPTASVPLENCGHFPLEEPGLGTLEQVVRSVVATVR